MKRRIVQLFLASVMAGTALLGTGCQKEKPYSSYAIGATFPELPKNENGTDISSYEDAERLPARLRDYFFVAKRLDSWLIDNNYVRSFSLGNPVVIEGADLSINDRQAYQLYTNEVQRLDAADLAKVLVEAQKESGSSALKLTTSGSVKFVYELTRTSTLPAGTQVKKTYTVEYAPLGDASTPSNPE